MTKMWVQENRRNLICVDSYDDGVLKGRFFDAWQEAVAFDSLSQFLIRMEQLLEERQLPQSYTETRRFSAFTGPEEREYGASAPRKGKLATFELRVLFRQNTSWQGSIHWRETGMEQSFRSVLELVLLLDSALRSPEGKGVA